MPKVFRTQRDESLAFLREELKPGDTVYCILRHVSRSGMVRDIAPIVFSEGQPRFLWWHVANVLGWRAMGDAPDAVRVNGAGMDMGFHLVYTLAHVLFGDGYALKHRWL